MSAMRRLSLAVVLAATTSLAGQPPRDTHPEHVPGGANAPPPDPPPKLVVETAELSAGAFAVRVPTGTYTAPPGGAPLYSIPGPIVSFKSADGVWRGHGYLETYPRLEGFTGSIQRTAARLQYTFDQGKSHAVELTVKDGAVLMTETSNLGPRNLYVFDCTYGGWQPTAGFAVDVAGRRHGFLYLPCHYDKPEVTIRYSDMRAPGKGMAPPGGVAVLSADLAKTDVAGFWCRDLGGWKNGDRMGIQLWQRRQLPGRPASRHFLGPETKSDSTPNPRTAPMLGKGLYEGHVTIELTLGVGTRKLGFAAASKGATRAAIPEAFKALMRAIP